MAEAELGRLPMILVFEGSTSDEATSATTAASPATITAIVAAERARSAAVDGDEGSSIIGGGETLEESSTQGEAVEGRLVLAVVVVADGPSSSVYK